MTKVSIFQLIFPVPDYREKVGHKWLLIYSNSFLLVENVDPAYYNYSTDVNYDCLNGEINE